MERTRYLDFIMSRSLAVIAALALLGLLGDMTGARIAAGLARQDPGQTPSAAGLTHPPVTIHNGTCARLQAEPVYDLGTLTFQSAGVNGIVDDLRENELLGGPAVDGRNDADIDGDGVLDRDEAGYLDEDLDGDGVLDAGEDLDGDGALERGIDLDADGIIDDAERLLPAGGPNARIYKAEEEVDATFDDLFESAQTLVVHQSAAEDATIVACGELTRPDDAEDKEIVVVGLRPIHGSGYYGYAVFERDTSNIPIFGDNTTGVTVYLFHGLDTRLTGTPTSEAEGTPASQG